MTEAEKQFARLLYSVDRAPLLKEHGDGIGMISHEAPQSHVTFEGDVVIEVIPAADWPNEIRVH